LGKTTCKVRTVDRKLTAARRISDLLLTVALLAFALCAAMPELALAHAGPHAAKRAAVQPTEVPQDQSANRFSARITAVASGFTARVEVPTHCPGGPNGACGYQQAACSGAAVACAARPRPKPLLVPNGPETPVFLADAATRPSFVLLTAAPRAPPHLPA
jgi:hypothetical protein